MIALGRRRYGNEEQLQILELSNPICGDDQIIVSVKSSSVNPADYFIMSGMPKLLRLSEGLLKPKREVLGRDYAGEVIEVGKKVSSFVVGDFVYGEASQTYAETISIPASQAHIMPSILNFDEAACVPLAGLTAVQALAKVEITQGSKVLVSGGSGGVGTFAVQIARSKGGVLTVVCSESNRHLVERLGATHVVDYNNTDITESPEKFDVVFDAVGNRKISDLKKIIEPNGTYLAVGVVMNFDLYIDRTFGPIGHYLKLIGYKFWLAKKLKIELILAKPNLGMSELSKMIEEGEVRVEVEKVFTIGQATEAFKHVGSHHAKGKVALRIQ